MQPLCGHNKGTHVMTVSVTLTDRAAERFAQIVSNAPENNMLKVSVEGGGCSGFEYRFASISCPARSPKIF